MPLRKAENHEATSTICNLSEPYAAGDVRRGQGCLQVPEACEADRLGRGGERGTTSQERRQSAMRILKREQDDVARWSAASVQERVTVPPGVD